MVLGVVFLIVGVLGFVPPLLHEGAGAHGVRVKAFEGTCSACST